MTRPTLGREAPLPASVRPPAFPDALASALDRAVDGAPAPVAGPPAPVPPAPVPPAPALPAPVLPSPVPHAALAAVPDPPAGGPREPAGQRGGRPGPAPVRAGGHGRMALVPAGGATGDTPGAARDHLIESVDAGAVPLLRAFHAQRCQDVRSLLL